MALSVFQVIFVFIFVIQSGFSAPQNASYADVEIKQKCAKLAAEPMGSRIIQGEVAEVGAFPYMASLRRHINQKHFCGGSMIFDNWVLTAAHCLDGQNASDIYVVVGTNNLDEGGIVHEVSFMTIHPKYSSRVIRNDIGLVKVSKSFQFGQLVKSIPLTRVDLDEYGYPATLSGWGRYSIYSQELPDELQYFTTCLVDRRTCEKSVPVADMDKKICTFTRFNQGICNGDSGSPLVADGFQIGIASYGINGCALGYPDFYTAVYAYTDWIHSVVQQNS